VERDASPRSRPEKNSLTRLLLLRELAFEPRAPLRRVADRLGISVQAVSVHARRLTQQGYLRRTANGSGGAFELTPKGIQGLHEGFTLLKRTVDDSIARMAVVRVTSAIAAAPVAQGDSVGLFMEQGELMARPGAASPSTGTAIGSAEAGDEVQVRDLSGVVALVPGPLTVLRVPSPEEGGSRRVSVRRTKALLREKAVDAARVGALGTAARALAGKLGLSVHLHFAPVEASFNAAELGVPVLLLVSRDLLPEALVTLDARNSRTLRRVPIVMLDAPETGVDRP
jgi:putative transcriptional regulator